MFFKTILFFNKPLGIHNRMHWRMVLYSATVFLGLSRFPINNIENPDCRGIFFMLKSFLH